METKWDISDSCNKWGITTNRFCFVAILFRVRFVSARPAWEIPMELADMVFVSHSNSFSSENQLLYMGGICIIIKVFRMPPTAAMPVTSIKIHPL